MKIYVPRYPQGERFAVSTGGGNGPVWGPDGREIFFQGPFDGVQKLMAVSVTPEGDALRLGKPAPLLDMRVQSPTGAIEQYAGSGNARTGSDVLPDGRFVMIRGADPQPCADRAGAALVRGAAPLRAGEVMALTGPGGGA